ncbi:MAG: uroporphyrinogen decarboxylase family protein [candidate division KSB1 bacterium]|jgi:MtaA/CmuA family methyltransferase|nr:uroporphyrinogen decarboxylase family protein [candidate division KSB1 bacterium]
MTEFERYSRCIQGKSVDHLPRIPIVMQFAAEYIGSDYAHFASDHKTLVAASGACADAFGFEQVSAISDPYRETHGFGAKIEFVRDGVPRCIDPPLAHSKELALLQAPDPEKSGRMVDRLKAVGVFKEKYGDRFSILGWVEGPAAEAATLRTVNNFLLDIALDPDYTAELMDVCTVLSIEFARAQISRGADTIGIGDAIASQVSADTYRQMIWPREKRLVDAIRDAGAYSRLHICGDISHLLEMIAELDVDILDVDHMVDLKEVRKKVGPDVVIAGNIDPVEGIRNGAPDAIRQYLIDSYRDVGNPFMVNAGCEIPVGTPNENLLALCEPVPYQIDQK